MSAWSMPTCGRPGAVSSILTAITGFVGTGADAGDGLRRRRLRRRAWAWGSPNSTSRSRVGLGGRGGRPSACGAELHAAAAKSTLRHHRGRRQLRGAVGTGCSMLILISVRVRARAGGRGGAGRRRQRVVDVEELRQWRADRPFGTGAACAGPGASGCRGPRRCRTDGRCSPGRRPPAARPLRPVSAAPHRRRPPVSSSATARPTAFSTPSRAWRRPPPVRAPLARRGS